MKIVLFEDTASQARGLTEALTPLLDGGELMLFSYAEEKAGTFESIIFEKLRQAPYANATLIVADRDLSGTEHMTGLSGSVVSRAADELGIPECAYKRYDPQDEVLISEKKATGIWISLKEGFPVAAEKIISIEKGFAEIRVQASQQMSQASRRSPGKLLAAILGKPEYADKISLYASGDQSRLADIVRVKKASGDTQLAQISCMLGYWLWESILRFPGVLLNQVAAASYLNIREEQFHDQVQEVFSAALYGGPFHIAAGKHWWRGTLDDIVASENAEDGRQVASAKTGGEIAQSQCSEEAGTQAGYYCMLSRRPVSLKNSRPGLPWFPRGADLARVSKSQYDQLGPWYE